MSYELQASLLVDADTGEPIAPAGLNLLADKGIYQCRPQDIQPRQSHLDSLFDSIQRQEQLRLDKPLVHVVDREADIEHVDEQSRHADLRQRKVDIILSTLPLEEHGYHNYKLFEQDLVMVFSTSHPHISGSSITAEQFFSEQHILWNTHRMDTDTLDSVADTVLPKRRIAYKTSSALTGIVLAGDTDWLCVNARSIAEKVSRSDRFQICELPFKAKAVPIYMTWHHSQRSDR